MSDNVVPLFEAGHVPDKNGCYTRVLDAVDDLRRQVLAGEVTGIIAVGLMPNKGMSRIYSLGPHGFVEAIGAASIMHDNVLRDFTSPNHVHDHDVPGGDSA